MAAKPGTMCVRDPNVHDPGLAELERRHLAADGPTRADVQRALWEDRSLVKTFGPRGTVHLLATADLPMWTGALSALPSSVPPTPSRCASPPTRPTRSSPPSATPWRTPS
jgi:hypothetical protein